MQTITQVVRVHVTDGVAFVDQVPPGVVVQVTDYDVHPEWPERDREGRPCSRYTVTTEILRENPVHEDITENGAEAWLSAGWTPNDIKVLQEGGCIAQLTDPEDVLRRLAREAA